MTAVKNAQMAESPVLLLGGAAATLLKVCGCFTIFLPHVSFSSVKSNQEVTVEKTELIINLLFLLFILQGRGALQDIDQMSLFKPLCKYCATVTR